MVSVVKVAAIQMKMVPDKAGNIKKASELIRKAALKGAKIICLPELFNTLYFPQATLDESAKELAEPLGGKTVSAMSKLAKELKVVIVVPFYEKDGLEYFNSAAVIDANGKVLGAYRKMHIPHDPLFYEKNYFEEGDAGFKVFKTRYGAIAPLICFDQWFPEAARSCVLQGADIIFYPTAIGWRTDRKARDNWLESWVTIQRSHSIANGVHVVCVNRVGQEGNLKFWGNSFMTDAFGKIIKKAGKKEQVLAADLDLSDNERIRKGWGFLRNRRPEGYSKLILVEDNKISPSKLGYSFPAEWDEHSAIYLSWPHDKITFPKLAKVEDAYAGIIKSIVNSGSEDVNLFVLDGKMKTKAEGKLQALGTNPAKVHFHFADYADVWFRDYGPTFVVNKKEKKLGMVKWTFNSWGNKYRELLKDGRMPGIINEKLKLAFFEPGIVMEGGSIDANGKGTLLTTTQCLLNPNRNPYLSKDQIESVLKENLGVSNIIWLKEGIVGDDTDGHIDNLARFVNENTILCAFEDDKKDANYPNLKKNYDLLCSAKDQNKNPFNIVKLPVPKLYDGKKRLSASYANFYIANKVVLVPQFNLETDSKALEIIAKQFPERKTIGIDCSDLVYGCGTLHCISQQKPKV